MPASHSVVVMVLIIKSEGKLRIVVLRSSNMIFFLIFIKPYFAFYCIYEIFGVSDVLTNEKICLQQENKKEYKIKVILFLPKNFQIDFTIENHNERRY